MQNAIIILFVLQKDDGDSGNDEPSEEAGAGPAPIPRSNSDFEQQGNAPLNVGEPSPDEEMEPDDDAQRREDPDVDVEEEVDVVGVDEVVRAEEDQDDALQPAFVPHAQPVTPPSPPTGRLASRLALLTNPRPAYEYGRLTEELLLRIPPESIVFDKIYQIC